MSVAVVAIIVWTAWRTSRVVSRRIEAYRLRRRVSGEWLQAHAASETKVGWEGPRWRTPKERERMTRRQDRRQAMSVVPMRRAR